MSNTAALRERFAAAGQRDNQSLLHALAVIDVEGWDGPTATSLLRFVYDDLVRPLTLGLGLTSSEARQAESSGWGMAWRAMADPRIRTADSPWAVVWTAVRRVVFGEMLAARYGVGPDQALRIWRNAHKSRRPQAESVCSWTELDGTDDEPIALALQTAPTWTVAEVRDDLTAALETVGWEPETAATLVRRILEYADAAQGAGAAKSGWRQLASELGVPPWQVRRVMIVVYGEPGFPGLVERILSCGGVRDDEVAAAALRSTVRRSHRSPALAARRAAA